ncbi:MAG: hypothetical protein D6732_10405 [Methanobacteriota archaeon]|nr:MAG: hypothetical protein D6732_10405 [Euryarchaeota archaeon]
MKIHPGSDLNLEFGDIELPETDRDVLFLAGDIGIGKGALEFIKEEAGKSSVIYVLNNHEFNNHEYRDILSF